MNKYRPAGVVLALLFMLLFLGALGLRIWASGRSAETVGPNHIAAGADRVYVHVNGALFVLSAQGKLLQRENLAAMGQDGSVIDLRVLRDGRLLIVRQRPAAIDLCDPAGWQCTEVGQGALTNMRAQIKVVADEPSGRLFITDFAANRIWMLPLDGGESQPLTSEGVLRYPNDIAMDANGRLWIADSGHHRLVALERQADGTWVETRSLDARNRLTRDGRDWPMMLSMGSDGNWWVTQPTSHGGNGDLLVYHPENGVLSRMEIPGDSHPTDVAGLGAAMLVADMDKFKIYRVDVDSHAVSEFGDTAFRAVMREAAARKTGYQALVDQSLIGMIAAGVLMLVAAFWASPQGRRFTPVHRAPPLAASAAALPTLKEIHWLKRNPGTERMLRWTKPVVFIIAVVVTAAMGWAYFALFGASGASGMTPEKLKKLEEFKSMLLLTLFIDLALPAMVIVAMRNFNHRIGTDGYRLFVKLADGRQISLAPEQLVYGTRQIVYQGYIFPVQTGKGQLLYDNGEIETYLGPLLSRAKKLGPWEIFRYQLAHREPTTMISLVFVIMLLAMMYATGAWRHVLPGLG
jgi:sugar lactone lactonase YvrE